VEGIKPSGAIATIEHRIKDTMEDVHARRVLNSQ